MRLAKSRNAATQAKENAWLKAVTLQNKQTNKQSAWLKAVTLQNKQTNKQTMRLAQSRNAAKHKTKTWNIIQECILEQKQYTGDVDGA